MSIFREIAGYTFGHADVVRRAMSKKKASVLLAERESFLAGAAERGVEREVAETLFTDMESFANYAFNKSHAAAYAIISYRTAYLKCHHPRAYFAALLTSVLGNQTKIAEYIAECASRGIRVLPPSINESRMLFSVSGKHIRFGLLALKNVGRQFIEQILRERQNGPFASFEEFIDRMPSGDLNKRMVESLLRAGAFDGLGLYRSQMLAVSERMIDRAAEKGRNNLDGQLDMFSMGGTLQSTPSCTYPDIPEFGIREKLLMEKEAAGMYFSGQLLDEYTKHLADLSPESIVEYVGEDADPADKARVSFAGIVTSVTPKSTKNGDRMAFFTLEDRMGEIECIVFARQYRELSHLLRVENGLFVTGTLSIREDEPPKLLVNLAKELIEDARYRGEDRPKTENALPAEQEHVEKRGASAEKPSSAPAIEGLSQARRLFLRVPSLEDLRYRKAKNIVELFEGDFPVYFYDASTKTYSTEALGMERSRYAVEQLRALLGAENVIWK